MRKEQAILVNARLEPICIMENVFRAEFTGYSIHHKIITQELPLEVLHGVGMPIKEDLQMMERIIVFVQPLTLTIRRHRLLV